MNKSELKEKIEALEKELKELKGQEPKKEKKKRSKTPYNKFVEDNYNKIKSENPDKKFAEISKLVGEAWKDSPDNPKNKKN